jgi:integrase
MATYRLTDRFIQSIKPKNVRVDYADEKVTGLALRVTEAGAKSWSIRYRHRGRLRRLTLGSLDALTLAQARDRARDELHAASKGDDPAQLKQAARKAETVEQLADDFIAKYSKPRKKSWKADQQRLNRHVLPTWKHRAAADITRADVRQLVAHVAEESGPIEANRTVSLLSKLFAFGLNEDVVKASPATKIPKPGLEQSRDRVLNDGELRALWKVWKTLDEPMGDYFKLMLLTAQRGQEVRDMKWSDVDLASSWWTIPSTSAKNKTTHRVYLGASAGAIIAARLAVADKDDEYVLAGARGRRQVYEAAADFGIENCHPHDLRRTAASMMASGSVSRFIIGRVLNHVEQGVTKVYDRHSYDPEKQAALIWWDSKLRAIIKGKSAAVVPFSKIA